MKPSWCINIISTGLDFFTVNHSPEICFSSNSSGNWFSLFCIECWCQWLSHFQCGIHSSFHQVFISFARFERLGISSSHYHWISFLFICLFLGLSSSFASSNDDVFKMHASIDWAFKESVMQFRYCKDVWCCTRLKQYRKKWKENCCCFFIKYAGHRLDAVWLPHEKLFIRRRGKLPAYLIT